jgi:hypothetical protein
MNEFKQVALGAYIGRWVYNYNGVTKYFSVMPDGDNFVITWGASIADLNSKKNRIVISDSEEVHKRILSKARAGFEIVAQLEGANWTKKCYDEFDAISEVVAVAKDEYRKRKPRKRKISLLDWMDGIDEYRENDAL